MDIWALKRQGYSIRAIAKKLGLHRKTVKKYLETGEFPAYRKVKRKSALEPWYGTIGDWLNAEDYQATRIHEMLARHGYQGSYTMVKRYVRQVKESRDRIAYLRFETMPGQQAQVDFGDFQVMLPDGTVQTLYTFVMVLGFSRHMYVEFIEWCTMTAFLDCHINAFSAFGGVPGEVLYDNMRNVVVRRNVGKASFNDTFLDFSAHYGFKPLACPPYSPWYKGKVERPMDYIRERFWRGYQYVGLEQSNRDIRQWNDEVAVPRVHGTTKQKVSDRFELERPHLGMLPARPYDTSEKISRKVYRDCQVSFGANRYVVPHTLVGRVVLLKIKNGVLRVYNDDALYAIYLIPEGKGHLIAHPEFYEALRRDKEQFRRKYRIPQGNGKATRGLLKHGLIHELVQRRPLSAYDEILEVANV